MALGWSGALRARAAAQTGPGAYDSRGTLAATPAATAWSALPAVAIRQAYVGLGADAVGARKAVIANSACPAHAVGTALTEETASGSLAYTLAVFIAHRVFGTLAADDPALRALPTLPALAELQADVAAKAGIEAGCPRQVRALTAIASAAIWSALLASACRLTHASAILAHILLAFADPAASSTAVVTTGFVSTIGLTAGLVEADFAHRTARFAAAQKLTSA